MGLFDRLFGPRVSQIDVQEAQRRLRNGRPVIVDVRRPDETASGTVPGARRIPLSELGRRLDELPSDRQVLTICRSGNRSRKAARRLAKAGFDVVNVAGGMQAWRAADLPVSKKKKRKRKKSR